MKSIIHLWAKVQNIDHKIKLINVASVSTNR